MSEMLDTAFYLVLNMTIAGTLIGGFLLILRTFKRIPRLCIYVLWSTVFIRFVFPFAFSSEVSILKLAGSLIKKVVLVPAPPPIRENIKLTMSNMVGTANSYFPVTYKTDFLQTVFKQFSLVWFVGATLGVLIVSILYYFTSRELRSADKFKGNIYTSSTIRVPLVYGIFKQRIIIPVSTLQNKLELKYVLLHEEVHIKRHDNLYKLLAILTACIHFFNPFVWIYLGLFIKDMEVACDTKAVTLLPSTERKKYAETLLNFSIGQNVFMTSAFGSKIRVINVLGYKKMTNIGVALSVVFIFLVAIVLLTNPMK